MVNALNATFGRHSKARASHAKGLCAKGVFAPLPSAAAFSTTPIFMPGHYPAKVRFSIAGGSPHVSDKAPAARGMAIDISWPHKERLVLAMISAPVFFAANGESFLAYLDARRPDPATGKPDPARIEAANKLHTDSEAQRRWLAATPPSTSYATAPYFAVHTYLFSQGDGTKKPARWIFEPLAGRVGLTPDAAKDMPDHFLDGELISRLAQGPAEWKVLLALPEPVDPLHNPTAAWPENRKTVEVGRFSVVSHVAEGSAEDFNAHVFDPEHLPSGVEPAGDPIFSFRSRAYSVSASRRGL